MSKYYVYILRCSDNTLYTGYTHDLEKRKKLHNEGKGARYTRGRGPAYFVYFEGFKTKSDAMQREYQIKKLCRSEKMQLIGKINS